MLIAVAAESDQGLDAPVSPHFGQAPVFALVDCHAGRIVDARPLANPYLGEHRHGQIPQLLADAQAQAVLSGGMGAGAIRMFVRLGITPATGAAGSVREAVEEYLRGHLSTASPCADSVAHH
jgi:predicted Fe-Mo cluster-binding NifX family protein